MSQLSSFCTCTDTKCPMNPCNHEKGCAPCISKCLNLREIPSCFFHLVEEEHGTEGYTFEDFAGAVWKEKEFNGQSGKIVGERGGY